MISGIQGDSYSGYREFVFENGRGISAPFNLVLDPFHIPCGVLDETETNEKIPEIKIHNGHFIMRDIHPLLFEVRMDRLDQLHWELSVLAQAVAYSNLSGASTHVGLSQPQLSRIVAKIESHLNIVLLDRSAKRKSGWTPMAMKLGETYSKSMRFLSADVGRLVEGTEMMEIKVGTLEGLIPAASSFTQHLFEISKTKVIELDVHEISQLEELFFKGKLDFIFSFREPGRRKYKYVEKLGTQVIEVVGSGTGNDVEVISPYELTSKHKKFDRNQKYKTLISNSLEIRKLWIQKFGGCGQIPSDLKKEKRAKEGEAAVLLIAADHVSPGLWSKAINFSY